MEFKDKVQMWRLALEERNANLGVMQVFDSMLVFMGEQQREIERLKLENVALQPVYSRRQLEEKLQTYENALKEIALEPYGKGEWADIAIRYERIAETALNI
ncbi:hypothetical protein V7149_00410 [Bacillus sp. JJ1503]|uniref:hypothetical protein n=1 Tax=Bacillus sp. JJ1503 TaxID=3122956 RepID=UPI002FFDF34A